MRASRIGEVVRDEWLNSIRLRRELSIDAFVVMPNHLHGLVWIGEPWYVDEPRTGERPAADTGRRTAPATRGEGVRATRTPNEPPRTFRWMSPSANDLPGPRSRSLASFVAGFKSATTTRINTVRSSPGCPVWQRGFHEHIVRSGKQLLRIRRYIEENPARWSTDRENPWRSEHE